jgi:hypothetical protein
MSISVLVKVKEFTEFWRMWLNELYELEKSMSPLQGDELIPEIKNRYSLTNFFIDREEQDKDRFFMEVMKNTENIPLDLKALYLTLNAEIIQEWIKHIGYLRELKSYVESDNATFKDFEYVLDRAFDYFIDTYDGMSGALRCIKIDKSLREILSDEEAQKNHYLQSLEYRNKLIDMYKKGLEDIEAYLTEHTSEHDGYRIRVEVEDIIRDVEKAVDKAREL